MGTVVIPSTMGARLSNLLTTIANALGANLNLTGSGGAFALLLESFDGKSASLTVTTGDQGVSQPSRKLGVPSELMQATLVEASSAIGTLVAGTVDIALPNVVSDRLSVLLVTSGGTPGVLSVKRKDASTVTVQSWLSGTGIQAADTSTVKVYNFGQAAS